MTRLTSLPLAIIRLIRIGDNRKVCDGIYVFFCLNSVDFTIEFLVHMLVCMSMNSPYISLSLHQACAAYAFITIPSIVGIFHRLQLYLASGQVAVLNQALTQGGWLS